MQTTVHNKEIKKYHGNLRVARLKYDEGYMCRNLYVKDYMCEKISQNKGEETW